MEKRLYGGTVSASRDLQAMSEEVEHLKGRRATFEDQALEVMEELEPLDQVVEQLEQSLEQLEHDAVDAAAALAAAEGVVDAEIEAVTAQRAAVAEGVPAPLAETYEKLRAQLGGVGAARLAGKNCSGCHLTLPATELDRIKHASVDDLVFCDQCGRILVH